MACNNCNSCSDCCCFAMFTALMLRMSSFTVSVPSFTFFSLVCRMFSRRVTICASLVSCLLID